jgi:hypothetical protein
LLPKRPARIFSGISNDGLPLDVVAAHRIYEAGEVFAEVATPALLDGIHRLTSGIHRTLDSHIVVEEQLQLDGRLGDQLSVERKLLHVLAQLPESDLRLAIEDVFVGQILSKVAPRQF